MFGMFFIIALVNGVLTTRVRQQEQLAREREERTNALFQLTKELSKAGEIDEVLAVAIENIRMHFSIDSFFILAGWQQYTSPNRKLQKEKALPEGIRVADIGFKNSQKAGKFTAFPLK